MKFLIVGVYLYTRPVQILISSCLYTELRNKMGESQN
uniref:Uncharacterized protein n=1 Tax=Rhizophora mucronata TaxID=61149 RepID=A0A2P2K2Z4_RHIMU